MEFLDFEDDEAEVVHEEEFNPDDVKAILAKQIADAKAAGKEYQGKK